MGVRQRFQQSVAQFGAKFFIRRHASADHDGLNPILPRGAHGFADQNINRGLLKTRGNIIF